MFVRVEKRIHFVFLCLLELSRSNVLRYDTCTKRDVQRCFIGKFSMHFKGVLYLCHKPGNIKFCFLPTL